MYCDLFFIIHHKCGCTYSEILECTFGYITLHTHGFCISIRKGGTGGGGWCHLQGAVHMVAARLGWDWVGHFPPSLHGQAYKTLPSPCRGLVSGKEGCLGSERV